MDCGLDLNALPIYDIVDFLFSPSEGTSELTIRCYGKQFHIRVLESNLEENSEAKILYQDICTRLECSKYTDINCDTDPMEVLCFWIAYHCNPRMRELAPLDQTPINTLEDWFTMETVFLTMCTNDSEVVALESKPDPALIAGLVPRATVPSSAIERGLPVLHPSLVMLPPSDKSQHIRPTKVIFESKSWFFKSVHSSSKANREIDALLRLRNLISTETCHFPVLRYLVMSPSDHDDICGFLLEHIEHRDSLGGIEIREQPLHVRVEWSKQLTTGVRMLHEAGIVWGDVKPHNILVDMNNNLQIVDFGGGFTQGWVDEDKTESIEGDRQGVLRILDFLEIGDHCLNF